MRWIIFIVIYVLVDIYAFQAIKTITKISWVHYLYLGISVLVLGNFLFQFLQSGEGRVLSVSKSYAFGFLLSVLSAKIILVLFLFGEDLVRLVIGGVRKITDNQAEKMIPSRRGFVSKIALGIAAIPFASLLYGMYKGKYNFQVLKYELEFDDLPDAFDGYQITQISDVHSGSFDSHPEIEYAVNLVNEQKSDMIFFTGDLVNNMATEMNDWKALFSTLTAKDGVYSILGNHDYGDYVDWESNKAKAENLLQLKELQREMGWNLLLNEHKILERGDDQLAIVGVENWGAGGFVKHGDADKASEGLSSKDFKIMLSHDPSYWQEKLKNDPKKYQLTLSGHTHGMQFGIEIPGWIKWSPIKYRYKNWAGIYKEFGNYINVNRGFGYLGYPGRVGIWPEITVIKLKKKS
ncbi:metallophosphoesterase [Mesonia aestuariivivens]|uniref:Metallophosphoesterase n=1 Tax=Mesonia aestuariivivens TaxID=2796128 RepID=A0ABS6W1Z8_9FLAO|nr:metallophosphoesterase [Mesonia aestuariivivens]MBW2961852.1 metallophosphoesterase [Mesonia aestuariivivens]